MDEREKMLQDWLKELGDMCAEIDAARMRRIRSESPAQIVEDFLKEMMAEAKGKRGEL